MMRLQDLSMQFGEQHLFSAVNLDLNVGARYGLVGANGAGKSTLMSILSGQTLPNAGQVVKANEVAVGWLQQDHFQYENERVIDVVLQGRAALWAAMQEKKTLLGSASLSTTAGYRLAELEAVIQEQEGYAAKALASELLVGLGIETALHAGPMQALSGGYKLRVLLAKLLLQAPDMMLLDEPTNHLDIVSIQWLQQYLCSQFKGCLLFISHDQHFLNALATHILDLDYQTITLYTGNYERHTQMKAMVAAQQTQAVREQQRKIAQLQTFVDRLGAKASKAKQAKSKQKQMDRLRIEAQPTSSRRQPGFAFSFPGTPGKRVLQVTHLSKTFVAGAPVLEDFSLTVMHGQKLAIIGANGLGKSTCLKLFLGELAPDQGSIEWGPQVKISYFAQDHHAQLTGDFTVLDWARQFAAGQTESSLRAVLGRALLTGDAVHKRVSQLSGGEGARLLLTKMMLEQANVLILDEPTNHMDMESIAALARALKAFQGTVILVSHDRYFMAQCVDRVLELNPQGVQDHVGDPAAVFAPAERPIAVLSGSPSAKSAPVKSAAAPLDHAARQKLQRRLTTVQRQIEQQEQALTQLDAQLTDGKLYQAEQQQQLLALQRERETCDLRLSSLLETWEKLMYALEGE